MIPAKGCFVNLRESESSALIRIRDVSCSPVSPYTCPLLATNSYRSHYGNCERQRYRRQSFEPLLPVCRAVFGSDNGMRNVEERKTDSHRGEGAWAICTYVCATGQPEPAAWVGRVLMQARASRGLRPPVGSLFLMVIQDVDGRKGLENGVIDQ